MILDSMQVKKEILKVVPLEVGQGGLHTSEPEVLMMFDLIFPAKREKVFLRQICINFSL